MKWLKKLFGKTAGGIVNFSGTISSDSSKHTAEFVTVLKLETEHDKSEFNEGYTDGTIDAKAGREREKNLNYPFHPYARGYMEAYNYHLRNNQ